ncbi:MAG TPA: type II secretion system F family protein [Glaciihabitans sp.]|jgi:tight adherence protein C|nr:type II secretion system F family protein [Glaciihabitans sp.]
MTGLNAWAVLYGLGLGSGLWLLLQLVPQLRRPRLAMRVAPYVMDLSAEARSILDRRSADPLPVVGLIFDAPLRKARELIEKFVGGAEVTQRRLHQAGLDLSVEDFRARQLVSAALGGAVGIAVASGASIVYSVPALSQVVVVCGGIVAGFIARDLVLQRAAAARTARMAAELPTVLEFLTLSLSAGEGILDALRRVSHISRGELSAELAGVTNAVATGLPLGDTLAGLAKHMQIPAFTRAVDQIVGALERGTPLADVLRAQAQDSRDEAGRTLLELSGKKEVAMLLPLVFLILPLTILFALLPGVFVLQVGF